MPVAKILVVDDEPSVLRMLEIGLQSSDHDIRTAATGLDALWVAERWQPDLVLLDVVMPDVDGEEVCRRLRQSSTMPVVLLTALRGERVAAQGLEAGADECVTKPFSVADLSARVRAALRRQQWVPDHPDGPELTADRGRLKIDLAQRLVYRDDRVVPLSDTQFRLLAHLAANQGEVLPYRELLELVWGPEHGDDASLVQTHVALLQRNVEENPQQPRLVVHVAGLGVQLVRR